MKILIAYDGTECSDAAIVDLRRAGLPCQAEVKILTVAEVGVPECEAPYLAMVGGGGFPPVEDMEPAVEMALQTAGGFAEQAAIRLRANFPRWIIKTETWADSARSAIRRVMHGWKPDLVVVGSHGRSGLGRLVLGSVSQNVMKHADCTVRISRHHLHPQEQPIRLIIGTDGSDGAHAAVRAVARRAWPANTEIRVIGVVDSRLIVAAVAIPEGIASAITEEESLRKCLSRAVHEAVTELAKSGLRAAPQVLAGVPSAVLVAEAETWGADCIFVGARGRNGLERVLLGSACCTVSARAHCSVEVVRERRS